MVNTRFLGRSGLRVSEVIFGNWITHGGQIADDIAQACVHAALDAGITTFDTADVYANTKAEEVLGRALAGSRRESLEILTKVYWPTGPGGPNDSGLSRKHIIESINGSLRRLGTDYVDLYQAHRWDDATPIEETMHAFADIVRSGKALYIGVSEWTADQIRLGASYAREFGFPLVSNQPQYSALWRVIEDLVIPASREAGLSQICWSPLAQGVLAGKYLPGKRPPADSRAAQVKPSESSIGDFMTDDILTRVQLLKPLAQELGLTMSQFAIAWVLQNPGVAGAIIGASRPAQITENAKASGVAIPAEIMAQVDQALGDVIVRDPTLTQSRAPHRADWHA
jgi:aryl-alcohol dehydrogenase-like predicted oxidoreductase